MSIWCSHYPIGYIKFHHDHYSRDEVSGGWVRAYAYGWSNHYPTEGVEAEASITLAHIPAWCVPGRSNSHEDEFELIAPVVRLDFDSPEAKTWWEKDEDGNPAPSPLHGSVVLDEEAARSLVTRLTDWLERPKLHPVEESA